MKHHPFTEIWPLLSGKAFERLKADIKANGLKMPVLVYRDQVLDGRNRQRACEEIGAAVRYVDADVKNDNEALNLVVSLNQYRRHLTVAELAFAAERLAALKHGSNQFWSKNKDSSVELSRSETRTLRDAAEAVNSSYGSAKRARTIRLHGTVEDINDVIAGRTSLMAKSEKLLGNITKIKRPTRDNGDRILKFTNAPPIKAMTREQVDPEFKGTPVEFTDKYGHVQVMTAEQYATQGFSAWATNMKALAKRHRELPGISRPVDRNWLRSPKPYDLVKLREAMQYLRPIFAEAESLLARAEMQAPSQPAVGSPPTG
jgi:ParB-like chromosome segregation protein Spo0J